MVSAGRSLTLMASCSLPHEVFDKNPGNGCEGDAADEHVANIVSRGARSHRCFVVFGSDWTFVRVHRTLLIHENRRKTPTRLTASGRRQPERPRSNGRRKVAPAMRGTRDRQKRSSGGGLSRALLSPRLVFGGGRRAGAAVRHEGPRQGRPASLMGGAETLSSLAMKVFIEEEGISPRRIVLEAWICSMRRTTATRLEQKQTQKAALKLRRDLMQICLLARSGGQLDRQIVAEEVVQMPE